MASTSSDTIAGKRILGFTPTAGSTERTKLLRLRVIAGHNLAKKDIFGASDPYTRIDLVTQVRNLPETFWGALMPGIIIESIMA
jgi:hypothetical protein